MRIEGKLVIVDSTDLTADTPKVFRVMKDLRLKDFSDTVIDTALDSSDPKAVVLVDKEMGMYTIIFLVGRPEAQYIPRPLERMKEDLLEFFI